MRVSGCDPTVEESIETAEYYVKAGCDYLQVSNGIQDVSTLEHDDALPYNRVAGLGVSFHEHFKGIVPVSCVNGKKAAPTVVIQSPMGGSITPEEIIKKTGPVDAVYVRVDENKAYWVKGDETGAVDLW